MQRTLKFLPLILVFIFLLDIIYKVITNEYCVPNGDFGLITLATLESETLSRLLGPYTRFGFNHPGPISFYWYALIDNIFSNGNGERNFIFLAQFICNSGLLFWALVLKKKVWSLEKCVIIGLFLVGALYLPHTSSLFNEWGPSVVIIPIVTLLIASELIVKGNSKALPLLAISGIIAVHNHLSTIPLVALISSAVLIYALRKQKFQTNFLIIFFSLIALGLLPIAIEAFSNSNFGNLGKVYSFVSNSEANKGFYKSTYFVFSLLGTPLKFLPGRYHVHFGFFVFLVSFSFYKTKDKTLVSLIHLSLLISIWTASKTTGKFYSHIQWYNIGIGMFLLGLALSFFIDKIKFKRALISIILILSYISYPMPLHRKKTCAKWPEEVIAKLKDKGIKNVKLNAVSKNSWKYSSLLGVFLFRNEINFCVDKNLLTLFGSKKKCLNNSSKNLYIIDKNLVNKITYNEMLIDGERVKILLD